MNNIQLTQIDQKKSGDTRYGEVVIDEVPYLVSIRLRIKDGGSDYVVTLKDPSGQTFVSKNIAGWKRIRRTILRQGISQALGMSSDIARL